MRERLGSIGAVEVPSLRSEPFHIESLLALGQLERASEILAQLEARGRSFPRLWITVALPRARALVAAGEGDLATAVGEMAGVDSSAALRRAPQHLTATERRVVELAARGMTNREVAAALFVSQKTVEVNLARAYGKLGSAREPSPECLPKRRGRRSDKRRETPDSRRATSVPLSLHVVRRRAVRDDLRMLMQLGAFPEGGPAANGRQ